MYCDQCGGKVEEGTKFCDQCGNRITAQQEERLSSSPVRQPALQDAEIQPAPVSPMYGVPNKTQATRPAAEELPKVSPGKAYLTNVVANWGPKLIEGLQYSPKQFYANVEAALSRREIPDLKLARVDWHEGGSFSAKREYLRIARKGLTFDICAAPFGTGFFVSWWLAEVQPSMKALATILALFPTVVYSGFLILRMLAFYSSLSVMLQPLRPGGPVDSSLLLQFYIGIPLVFLFSQLVFFVLLSMLRRFLGEDLFEIPIAGPLLAYVFKRPTYYKADTTAVYRAAVNAAVQEAVDAMTKANGLRALSPDERKPVMRDLLAG